MVQFSSLFGARLDEELGSADSTVLFTTARRKSAINRGIEQFQELTEAVIRWSTCVITGGTAEYDLNSTTTIAGGDFVRLAATPAEFRYTDASSNTQTLSGDEDFPLRDVTWLDTYQPGWRLSTVASSVAQLPQLYYLRPDGGSLYFGMWPPPSTGSSASAAVLIPYVAKLAQLSSNADEPFTVNGTVRADMRPFHQAVVHFAAYQLEKLRRDEAAQDRQWQLFLGYVTRFIQSGDRKGGTQIGAARRYFRRGGRFGDKGTDPRT